MKQQIPLVFYFLSIAVVFSPFVLLCQFTTDKDAKIYVAGHTGLVGRAIVSALTQDGYTNIITKTHRELDLANQQAVDQFFASERPEYVFLAAAKVGGILANDTYPADFIYQNLAIELNVIHACYKYQVKKLLFLGSSCIYPRDCQQPISESYLLSGPLEKTNQAYAIAKIAGIFLCKSYNTQYKTNFITCMPTNLYGEHDNFDLQSSHVLPALLKKFHLAKINNDPEVVVWGTGSVYREFLHVDDCANACIFLMKYYNENEIINVGTGADISIKSLATLIASIVGYEGTIVFDHTKPDGTPRKVLQVKTLQQLGWHAVISLEEGIQKTYDWCLHNIIF
jgi:GDP-L-fucose synthase